MISEQHEPRTTSGSTSTPTTLRTGNVSAAGEGQGEPGDGGRVSKSQLHHLITQPRTRDPSTPRTPHTPHTNLDGQVAEATTHVQTPAARHPLCAEDGEEGAGSTGATQRSLHRTAQGIPGHTAPVKPRHLVPSAHHTNTRTAQRGWAPHGWEGHGPRTPTLLPALLGPGKVHARQPVNQPARQDPNPGMPKLS